MFNFFHSLVIGVISAVAAFSGAFHTASQPPTNSVVQATSTPSAVVATTTTVERKREVKKSTPAPDNSPLIKEQVRVQVEAALKAKADQDDLLAKQRADEQAVLDAQKAELDRQTAQNAANAAAQQAAQLQAQQAAQNAADLAAQQAANAVALQAAQAAQAKQDKLNAVNQQIAVLNAKYAADIANVAKDPWLSQGVKDRTKQQLYSKYTDDYNTLMAQWQQIKYSN